MWAAERWRPRSGLGTTTSASSMGLVGWASEDAHLSRQRLFFFSPIWAPTRNPSYMEPVSDSGKSPALQVTPAGIGTRVRRTWTHTPRGRKIRAGQSGEGPPAARTSPRGHPPPRARQAFVLGAPTPPAPALSRGTKQPAPPTPTPSPGPGPGPSDFLGIAATLGTRGVRR